MPDFRFAGCLAGFFVSVCVAGAALCLWVSAGAALWVCALGVTVCACLCACGAPCCAVCVLCGRFCPVCCAGRAIVAVSRAIGTSEGA